MDLVTHVRLKLSTLLGSRVRDLEAAAYCTLFLPKENDMVKEVQDAGRFYNDMVENKPDAERGSPHIWFFVAMLKATKKIVTNKNENGGLSLPDQVKAEAIKMLRTSTDNAKVFELNPWIKACRHYPTNGKLGQPLRSRIIFAVEDVFSYTWKKEADGDRWRRYLLTSQDGSNKRRMNIQDLIRHTMLLRGADAPPGTVPRGNLARELRKAISSEKGKGKREKGAFHSSQMEVTN